MKYKDDIGQEITIRDLYDLFANLINKGCGDMKLKLKDGTYIHNDELSYDFNKREITIVGDIFRQPIYDKVRQLEYDIQAAFDKFLEN